MSNRYTQLTPSAYNPMSLQEIMMAPTIQKGNHDQTNAKIEEYLTSLNSIDPHSKHWEYAQKEKQRLTEELDRNASTLAQKGFSPDITDNMMKFNRDYQSSVSPTGMLGQIQGEHANIKAQEDLMRQNYSSTYGGDRVEEILAEEMAKYKEQPSFDDKGRITSYKPRQLAKHVNVNEEARSYFKDSGLSQKDWSTIRSGLQETPDGKLMFVGKTTEQDAWANNNSEVKAVVDFMSNRILDPSGDLHQTILDQGRTPQSVVDDIFAMKGIYNKSSTTDNDFFEMNNLMGTNAGAGNDQPQPVQGVYVKDGGTYAFTEDFNTLVKQSQKTLDDPHSSPVDKAKALDTRKLITDIENELIDPESQYYDKEYIKSLNAEEEVLNSLSTETLKEIFKKTMTHRIFGKSLNQDNVPDGHVRFAYQYTNPENGKFTDEPFIITDAEWSEIQKDFKEKQQSVKKSFKILENKRNDRLNQHAHQELKYVVKHDKTTERTVEAINLFRSTNINNMIPANVNITNENIPETVNLNDKDKLKLASIIRRSNTNEINSILPTQIGREVGFNIEIAFNSDNEAAEGLKLNGELVNVFIPISTSTEQVTGHESSAMMNISMLPESYQEDFKKMIDTRHLSSVRDFEDLGLNAVPGENIFGKTFEGGGEADFLETKGDTPDENYVTMYGRINKEDEFKPLTWETVFRYDILNDGSTNSDNYQRIITSSGIKTTLTEAAKKYKADGRTLHQIFNLGSSENADWEGLIKELRHREIRLSHTRDTFEITRLKLREQYE